MLGKDAKLATKRYAREISNQVEMRINQKNKNKMMMKRSSQLTHGWFNKNQRNKEKRKNISLQKQNTKQLTILNLYKIMNKVRYPYCIPANKMKKRK